MAWLQRDVESPVRRHLLVPTLFLALAVLGAACTGDDEPASAGITTTTSRAADGDTTTASEEADAEAARAYAEPGPYPAGVRTEDLGDGRLVEIWYPAEPGSEQGIPPERWDLRDSLPEQVSGLVPEELAPVVTTDAHRLLPPAQDGPFPVVLYSHGFGGVRTLSSDLTSHLASWGMIVAAPDHATRGPLTLLAGVTPEGIPSAEEDLQATADLVRTLGAGPSDPLSGLVADGPIGLVGHSAGGGSAFRLAGEPFVAGYVAMASPVGVPRPPQEGEEATTTTSPPPADKPSLLLAGAEDDIAELERVERAYAALPAPKELVVIEGAGHQAFADVCLIQPEAGGIVGIAEAIGLTLTEQQRLLIGDGCFEDEVDVAETFPVINHTTTAWLRHLLGVDPDPVGLGPELETAYAPVMVQVQQEP